MSLLSWLGQKIGLTDSGFWRTFYGGETWAGEPISPETAMQVSAFWACVRLLSQTIGTLPLGLYIKKSDGSREPQTANPLYTVLHDMPNADATAVEFWEGMAASLCISGNAFAEKQMSGGEVIGLKVLCADWMIVERTLQGILRYRYRDPRGAERIFLEDTMFHIRGFGTGGDVGLSPIAFARQSLSSSRAVERAAATVFANGMRPSGWLVYKGGLLSPEQRAQTKKVLIDPMSGAENAGKTGILEADFEYKQMSMPPEDAQMLETRAFNVEDVCRWLGVPPILIGHASQGQTMWGSGIEQILIGWLTLGLRPYLTRIEQAVKRSLIPPAQRRDIYAEFNVEGLLRADSAGRAALYATMSQNGIFTRNEIRAKENMPSKPGGDVLTVQSNMITLEDLAAGNIPAAQAQVLKAALRNFLSLEEAERPPLRLVSGGQ